MEFFFGDESVDIIAPHFLEVLLKLDLKLFDLFLYLRPGYRANIGVEMDLRKVARLCHAEGRSLPRSISTDPCPRPFGRGRTLPHTAPVLLRGGDIIWTLLQP